VLLLFRLRSALERSEERLMVVLEGLEAAVRVDGVLSGALLYMNGRCRALFSDQTPSPADRGEVFHAPTQRWYLVQSQPLRWVDGRAALLRIFSDVTEIRRAREVVDKHKEAAHRSARLVALGEFASAIAHELSQPLAAISTYNTTALRLLPSEPGESELRIAIQKCSDQAQRAGAIIQRLREILRQPVAPRVREDLNEVARAGLELAQGEAEELGVDVKFQPCAQPLKVRVDRLLVEQVVVNLLRNAVEAVSESRMGAPREVVLVTDSTSPGHALLSVEDTGDGVSPDVQRQLFEPFVTTKPSGLGLGLSICRSVVEAQEGTIHYEPLPRGSRFVVTLPAYA
ncbi:MAG TPA: ATP-binding protein, partial [Burkholderiales bacterium]|nr:ATP-binding protein [Burkholderiales bacterium]